MSVVEPPNPDDEWESLIGQLGDLDSCEDEVDLSKMGLGELVAYSNKVLEELKQIDSIVHPVTPRGRELHSAYTAAIFIMKNRK
jgi:hypothetical protein